MRLLIIDNGTRHLEELKALCADGGKHTVTVATTEQYSEDYAGTDLSGFDAVVLSGSYNHSVVWNQDYFLRETQLIMDCSKPILGICLGFELICYAYGNQLHEMAERIEGANKVTPTEAGSKIFQGTDPILVTEAHRWNIEDLENRELVVLARSETGIEAIKHKTKPIYGLQFHPESFKYGSDAKLVFENIFDSFEKA